MQEQQRRRQAEKEAALGFNPKPSKFMDLDQLQHQGTPHPTPWAGRGGAGPETLCHGNMHAYSEQPLETIPLVSVPPLLLCEMVPAPSGRRAF
jgi:hypothetical protein